MCHQFRFFYEFWPAAFGESCDPIHSHPAVPALIHLHNFPPTKDGAALVRSRLSDLRLLLDAEVLPGAQIGSSNMELYQAGLKLIDAIPQFMADHGAPFNG